MLEKVKAYKLRHGHCRVPRDYAEDRVLGRWVSNIRSGNTKTVSPWGKRKGGAAASTDAGLEGGAGHGDCVEGPGGQQRDRAADEVAGLARLNELGFCWHVKNSYRHAEKSKLYDMDDAEQLLHPDTLSAIAVRPHALCSRGICLTVVSFAVSQQAMGKPRGDLKVRKDLVDGIRIRAERRKQQAAGRDPQPQQEPERAEDAGCAARRSPLQRLLSATGLQPRRQQPERSPPQPVHRIRRSPPQPQNSPPPPTSAEIALLGSSSTHAQPVGAAAQPAEAGAALPPAGHRHGMLVGACALR